MYSKISFGSQYNYRNYINSGYVKRTNNRKNNSKVNINSTLQQKFVSLPPLALSHHNSLISFGRTHFLYPEGNYLEQLNNKNFYFSGNDKCIVMSNKKNESGYFEITCYDYELEQDETPKDFLKKQLDEDVKGVELHGRTDNGFILDALYSRNKITNQGLVRIDQEHPRTHKTYHQECTFNSGDPNELIDAIKFMIDELEHIYESTIWK